MSNPPSDPDHPSLPPYPEGGGPGPGQDPPGGQPGSGQGYPPGGEPGSGQGYPPGDPQSGDPQSGYYGYGGFPPRPPGYGGDRLKRPGTVIAGAIMCWVGSAFGVVIGLVLAAASSDEQFRQDLDIGSDTAHTIQLIGILLALWCVMVAVFALLAFLRHFWAAIVLGVMALVYTAFGIYSVATSGTGGGILGLVYTWAAVGLIFGGSRAWFRSG